jgi:hypothetical protein
MRMMIAALSLVATLAPAVALDEPAVWRDETTGCAYFLLPGAITPRLTRDGLPDCPAATPQSSGTVVAAKMPPPAEGTVRDGTVRELIRTVERLSDELANLKRDRARRRK